jgi:hypothetical protein
MKPGKKQQRKLEARIKGHSDIEGQRKQRGKRYDERAFKRPGSRNPRKG